MLVSRGIEEICISARPMHVHMRISSWGSCHGKLGRGLRFIDVR